MVVLPDPEDRMVEDLAVQHNIDLIRYIARRVRSVADAKEIAQETYVRLLRLDRKDLIRDPRSYLYRVAGNIIYEFELKRRASDTVCLTDSVAETVSAPQANPDLIGLASRMETVLAQLSPKCRAVLILHRREGLTYREISDRIGISVSMVKKYLVQGLDHCRAALSDYR